MRSVTKQILCPSCGVVIADATYTRWSGNLVLTSPDGYRIQPEGVALQLRRAEVERDTAASVGARAEAEERIAFLERHLSELVYVLRCRNGHSTPRTMPQLARDIRQAQGRWVEPS